MLIFPAIDLYDKKAVRLFKGDYAQMTIYSDNPVELARDFKEKGATCIHLVDLEGAKSGATVRVAPLSNYIFLSFKILLFRFHSSRR